MRPGKLFLHRFRQRYCQVRLTSFVIVVSVVTEGVLDWGGNVHTLAPGESTVCSMSSCLARFETFVKTWMENQHHTRKAGTLVLKSSGMYLQLTVRLYSKVRYHEQQISRAPSSLGTINTEPHNTAIIAKQEDAQPLRGSLMKPASNTSTDKVSIVSNCRYTKILVLTLESVPL
jgi:hypothetical protein